MRPSAALPLAAAVFATLALGCGWALGQPAGPPDVTPTQLAGSWKGLRCETAPWSNISRRRQFVFTDTTWRILFQVYDGKSCRPDALLFSADFGGSYRLGANSSAVPGAREARFAFDHKLVTPTATGMDFVKPRCPQYGWTPGAARDVSRAGCADLFVATASCPTEYDLTAIIGGELHLGDRGHRLCTPETRPTKLQRSGFTRD